MTSPPDDKWINIRLKIKYYLKKLDRMIFMVCFVVQSTFTE